MYIITYIRRLENIIPITVIYIKRRYFHINLYLSLVISFKIDFILLIKRFAKALAVN
jgi:hypothetical protein